MNNIHFLGSLFSESNQDGIVSNPIGPRIKICHNWPKEKEEYLKKLVKLISKPNWKEVSKQINHVFKSDTTPTSCAYHWSVYLDPHLNHSDWTPEEDQIIKDHVKKYGHDWQELSLKLKRSCYTLPTRFKVLSYQEKKQAKKLEKIEIGYKDSLTSHLTVDPLILFDELKEELDLIEKKRQTHDPSAETSHPEVEDYLKSIDSFLLNPLKQETEQVTISSTISEVQLNLIKPKKKPRWMMEYDDYLKKLVEEHPKMIWKERANKLNEKFNITFNVKTCHARWTRYLDQISTNPPHKKQKTV